MQADDRKKVASWLLCCCALVFAMVVVGGITRLTRSGLSIVEWQPLIGALPPLSTADWQALFDKYRLTPEFRLVNPGMDLDGFKGIFWWEYLHRLLGRLVGVVFFVPYAFFLATKTIRGALAWQLGGVFLLGALQGALGWYMVKSGLVDEPRVSQFRLVAHLGLALLILASMFWISLGLLSGRTRRPAAPAVIVLLLVFLMILSGGFVAGIRAGHAYPTFPLMNGALVPDGILMLEPWYRNFFYNPATIQFVHRGLFWVLLAAIPLLWWRQRNPATSLLLAAFALQATLGITTLVLAVPVPVAAAHQAGAVLVLVAALWSAHGSGTASGSEPAR